MMTKNAVQQIEEAEHKAKEYQALAVEQAKKLLSDAERQGQADLEQALREAEAQRREQDTQAEQAAQLRADAIMTERGAPVTTCGGRRKNGLQTRPHLLSEGLWETHVYCRENETAAYLRHGIRL